MIHRAQHRLVQSGRPVILRSLDEVRRQYCQPIDPLVCGVLGSGPDNYGLTYPPPSAGRETVFASGRRRNARGSLVWLIGHWD